MKDLQANVILRHLRKLAAPREHEQQPDAELLRRFATVGGEAAFETLLQRHGPMVLQVAQRVLRNREDAEDVFQAVFLTLARKALSIRKGESLGAWLHGVAHLLALQSQRVRARREAHEGRVVTRIPTDPAAEITLHEAEKILDEELQRLPSKYRAPLVLCYLEGATRDEAAKQLGLSLATLKRRLERSRSLLRHRLISRGLSLPAALAATLLGQASAPAALPGHLIQPTVRLGVLLAQGKPMTAGTIAVRVTELMGHFSGGMGMSKLQLAALGLVFGLLTAGAGVLAHRAAAANGSPIEQEEALAALTREADQEKTVRRQAGHTDLYGDPLPAEAICRLGTTRLRTAYASSLVFARDGNSLFALGLGFDSWDVATGKLLRRLSGISKGTGSLSPDGKLIASIDYQDRTVRLSDAVTGALLRKFGRVLYEGLSFSPDGKVLAAFGNSISSRPQATLDLWNVASGERVHKCAGHEGQVLCAAFTPDSKTLVSGGADRSIRLWDVATGKETRCMNGCPVAIGQIAVSPNATRLAIIGQLEDGWRRPEYRVRIWDMGAGTEIRQLAVPPNHDSLADVGFKAALFAPDGKTLVTGGADRYARVWDLTTGQEVKRIDVGCANLSCMALSPDGKVLAVGIPLITIRLIELASGKDLVPLAGHQGGVFQSATFSGKGSIVTAGYGPTFLVWDAMTGQLQCQVGKTGATSFSYSFARHGSMAVSTNWNEAGIRVWDLRAGTEPRRLLEDYAEKPPQMIALSADGSKLALSPLSGGRVDVFDTSTGKMLRHFEDASVHVFAGAGFDARGQMLALYCSDNTARLWNLTNGTKPRRLGLPGEGRQVGSPVPPLQSDGPEVGYIAKLSPDGKLLAHCRQGPSGGLTIYDVAAGMKLPQTFDLLGAAASLAFSPDGRMLACGGHSNNPDIYLLEVASGKVRQHLVGHQSYVVSLTFSSDGKMLVSGSMDTTALVWDLTGGQRAQATPDHALSAPDPDTCWTKLASSDAATAFDAMRKLARDPAKVVPFLATRLRAITPADAALVRRLVAELGSDQFRLREQAAAELAKLGELALPSCREALAVQPSAEVRRRLEGILQTPRSLSADQLRNLRAIELLEWIDTPEARRLMERIAQGASEARLTQEAKASLERLRERERAR
ncbi:MAG TPA: sigma-70 family RNA polymerase sigma factor [Gemmataceae bacterium]|nr:sigma-70 family RNA polymerase sigma factor [Gemmataceae bacterium]